MRVEVSLLPPAAEQLIEPVDLAIVIDVLRATSVMATALHHGAREIITCRTVDEAKSLADATAAENSRPLLCGERECRPIDGFDLGNSPSEYPKSVVAGRSLVLTTTNGTAAFAAAASAKRLLAVSFVNLSATVATIAAANSVHLICAGTNHRITGEDVLCAGALLDRLLAKRDPCRPAVELVGDETMIALDHWLGEGWRDNGWRVGDCRASGSLARRLAASQGGRNLTAVGYGDDIDTCALTDSKPAVVARVATDPPTFRRSDNAAG